MVKRRRVTILTGPTAVGKTELSILLAEHMGCPIISADSRQVYRGMAIGTAQPDEQSLRRVKHHLVGCRDVEQYYSAYEFEMDALRLLEEVWATGCDEALVTGGSMMYIDALCGKIDDIPTISDDVRQKTWEEFERCGLMHMVELLECLDPEYAKVVDAKNAKRVVHAIEICRQSGTTYTSLRTGKHKERPFEIRLVALQRERSELFERIGARVEQMMDMGLEDEARLLLPKRELNALNTVGYKEMFAYFDGEMSFREAKERIKKNTRVYAKKQMTWFVKNPLYEWYDASENSSKLADRILGK
ncbi:MAG: tRNA (adenosine(37)-N6)-dimethylallyltransferase MiaA [Marinilabiliaceae bacterium]|nr:tRNA (adenosine(37)-N6)-dimethylallyltransferase MiaA [Marinilabiliaceae bacterium]